MSTSNPSPQAPPHQPLFHLRPATPSDLPQIVSLQFQCFSQSVLIEKIANPDTPENRQSVLERHTTHMADPGCKVVVAVIPDSPGDIKKTETVVGFCMFYYPSVSEDGKVVLPVPLRRPPGLQEPSAAAAAAAARTATTTTTSVATIPPLASGSVSSPPSSDSTAIPISQTNIPTLLPYRFSTLQRLLSTAPNGAGYVRYMSVSPLYRRHGIGRALMDWGCERFDEAGVPVYLEATPDGEPLYKRYGFARVGEQVLEVYSVDGNEVIMGEKYACMWREGRKG